MPTAKPVALVTGGAKGIGRAIARHLLDSGWNLGVIDLPDSGLRRAFPPRSRNALAIEGDVRDEDTVSDAVDAIVHRFGRLDARRLQCRHHDPQAASPPHAGRMASRHRHQSDCGVSARARRRKTAAQSARRDRHHRLDACADVGAQYRVLFGDQRRSDCAHPCARGQPRPGRAGQLRQPRLDRDQGLRRACAARITRSIPSAASASRKTSPKSSPGCSTANAPASSPAPISSSTAA